MKHRAGSRDWTPLAKGGARTADLPTGEAFQTEWIDFARGIRVGHLEPHERITQILKFHLVKREGFKVELGDWEANAVFDAGNFKSAAQVRAAVKDCPLRKWAGFQLYYPMPRAEVEDCTGYEFVKTVCGVFAEVTPAMNACMQVALATAPP